MFPPLLLTVMCSTSFCSSICCPVSPKETQHVKDAVIWWGLHHPALLATQLPRRADSRLQHWGRIEKIAVSPAELVGLTRGRSDAPQGLWQNAGTGRVGRLTAFNPQTLSIKTYIPLAFSKAAALASMSFK